MRAPALIGAAVYLSAAGLIAKVVSTRIVIQWAVLAALAINPLMGDYFVAARGYSLAVAFLLLAFAIVVWDRRFPAEGGRTIRRRALSSLCLGVSFISNFSFAIVDGVLWLALLAWVRISLTRQQASTARLLAAFTLPGFCVTALVAGNTLLHFPRNQLYYGATSLHESLASVYEASLYRVNRNFFPPGMALTIERIGRVVLPLTGIAALLHGLRIAAKRYWSATHATRTNAALVIAALAAVLVSVILHVVLFRTRSACRCQRSERACTGSRLRRSWLWPGAASRFTTASVVRHGPFL